MENTQGNFISSDQMRGQIAELTSIVKIITDIPKSLPNIRHKFRGESYWEDEEGNGYWVQTTKPRFVKMDSIKRIPIKVKEKMPWKDEKGNYVIKEVYIPNDEAIEEVITMISFMGINEVTPVTALSEDDIVDDLREFEIELSQLLTVKQAEWGIDKETRPMIRQEIKTYIQDVRYMALKGQTLKQLATNVQRIEQVVEGQQKNKLIKPTPYG